MPAPKRLLAVAVAVGRALSVVAQDSAGDDAAVVEPADFNAAEALLEYGVAVGEIPGLSDVVGSTESGCSIACDTLKFLYGDGAIETREETAYTDFIKAYWSANQAEVSPYCVFKPAKPEHVSVLVLLARLAQCPFAARSGGHAAMTGASGVDGGITVSFMNMTGISLSEDKKIASIQPGNLWGKVYEELGKSDLTVIGGRLGNIGVGGLTTGGGISYFSSLYGWACDNVESYDVVIATGAIVRVSATEHPDLYWALRGGGNNFGLVVNFNLETYPLPRGEMWGGGRTYMEDTFPQLGKAFANMVANADDDPKAGMWHVYVYYNRTKFAMPTLYHSEPNSGDAAIFKEFNDIPHVADTTQNRIIGEFAAEGMKTVPSGLRQVYYIITSKADHDLLEFAKDLYFEMILDIADVPGLVPTLVVQGITLPMLRHMQKNGGNALGLEVEDGPFYAILMAIMWANKEDDEAVYKFSSDLLEKVSGEARKRGLYNDYLYMNYASAFQDVISSYGEENKARLKSIAAKYDPKEVFQKLQPGYFKLDRQPVPNSKYFSF